MRILLKVFGGKWKKIGFGDNDISFRKKKAKEGMSESKHAMVWKWHTSSLEEKGIRDKMVTKEATVGQLCLLGNRERSSLGQIKF